jgi:hypothetical protein
VLLGITTAWAALAPSCSAIVDPDNGRLRPPADSGPREGDSGPREGDSGPMCPGGCDDGIACTTDTCGPTGCTHAPDDAACGAGMRCNPGTGCVAARCTRDEECDDGMRCNGEERCDPGSSTDPSGCVAGTPMVCDDRVACTADLCVEALGGCVFTPRHEACDDGVACTADLCAPSSGGAGADGCVHRIADPRPGGDPGAMEVCGNARDDDCDLRVDEGCMATPPDTCANAQPILLDAGGRGSVSGVLGAFDDNYAFCGSSGGRDAVYFFEITSLSDVIIDTTGSAEGNDTVLGVHFSDCRAPILVCNDDQDPGAVVTSRIFLHRVAPPFGASSLRVYVYVDGRDPRAAGAFTLHVRVLPARPDACSSEPLDISGGGTVLGFGLISGVGAAEGTCQSITERGELEGIFRIRTPADRDHERISVVATSFTPDAYLRQQPCGSGTELACQIGRDIGGGIRRAELRARDLPPDTFQFLFVDGMLGTGPGGGPHAYRIDYDP